VKRFVLSLAFLFGALQAQAADPAPAYPAHTIPNTQLRALPKNADGRTYQLHIHLPGSFAKEPKRRYPVLYVTDGYWDFATVVASYNNLAYDKVVPEFIVVGLGYAGDNLDYGELRGWELSPVKLGPLAFGTGHADKFIASLQKDIFPLLEREYRGDAAQRYLAGSSLGGLFTLHAMYAKPELFKGYIAASPAVVAGGDWIIGVRGHRQADCSAAVRDGRGARMARLPRRHPALPGAAADAETSRPGVPEPHHRWRAPCRHQGRELHARHALRVRAAGPRDGQIEGLTLTRLSAG
jgi:predicted alpha/beta superfamily hydrolase